MFRTTKCSSSGRIEHSALWCYIMHFYKQSGRCQVFVGTQTQPDNDQTKHVEDNVIELNHQ